jgi:peptidyl-tRNA hydrolase
MILNSDKVFLVTRADLKPGQQAVQAAHALTEFIFQHPTEAHRWKQESNTLVMLVVPDEERLRQMIEKALQRGIYHSIFQEPDLENALTAIAFAPGDLSYKLCSGIPLALR